MHSSSVQMWSVLPTAIAGIALLKRQWRGEASDSDKAHPMTKPVLCLSLLLALTVSTVLAQDYFSLWSSQPADLRAGYLEGLLVGLKLSHTVALLQQEPEASWDAWQRVSMRVYKDVSQVDGAAVERGISDLYADPANAPIHM